MILELLTKLGPKWSEISKYLNGRPENKVKNRFYSHIKKTYFPDSLSNNSASPQRNDNSETLTYNHNNSNHTNNASPVIKDEQDKTYSESLGDED